MNVLHLPFEILIYIADLLGAADQYICSSVCRRWREPFTWALWNHVDIGTSDQLSSFLITITSLPFTRHHGKLVRKLHMANNIAFTKEALSVLQKYCTSLDELQMPSECFGFLEPDVSISWNSWKILTKLELSMEAMSITSLFSILQCLPALKSLGLMAGPWKASAPFHLRDFELLHSTLPLLEDLSLNVTVVDLVPEDERILETIDHANCLQSLTMAVILGDCRWLYYWTHKYPNIRSINWDIYDEEEDMEHFPEEFTSAFSMMGERYRYLENVNLGAHSSYFWQFEAFFDALYKSKSTLKALECTFCVQEDQPEIATRILEKCGRAVSNTLESLHINLVGAITNALTVPMSLGYCPHLVNLTILGDELSLSLDTVLVNCTSLRKICIQAADISINQDAHTRAKQHGLQEIHIISAKIIANVFTFLSTYCRDLSIMSVGFSQIQGDCVSPTHTMHIDMPFTRFKMLEFEETTFISTDENELSASSKINIFSIEQTNPLHRPKFELANTTDIMLSRWFHIYAFFSDYQLRMSSKEVGHLGIKRIKSYRTPLVRPRRSTAKKDPLRLKNGCVRKQHWQSDIPRGHVVMRCNSVSTLRLEHVNYSLYPSQ
ncbi:hypothetical protein CLU79DRAFT_742560 [Phycomyces nitens]|nr:hypothetical protein CLU79DRAFT_742560 [Phycomyces nitens]